MKWGSLLSRSRDAPPSLHPKTRQLESQCLFKSESKVCPVDLDSIVLLGDGGVSPLTLCICLMFAPLLRCSGVPLLLSRSDAPTLGRCQGVQGLGMTWMVTCFQLVTYLSYSIAVADNEEYLLQVPFRTNQILFSVS